MQGFIGKSPSVLLGLAALILIPAAGHGAPAPTPAKSAPVRLSMQESADLNYVRENTSISIPHQLNLADDRQYRYVLATLKRFGRTPEKAPQLYKMLEQAHKTGKAGPPMLMAADTTNTGGATLQGINYTSEFGQSNNNQSFSTTSYSTYPSASIPYNTQILVSLIDTKNNVVIGSNSANEFSKTNLPLSATGASPGAGIPVESNALFLIAPQKGAPLQATSVILTDATAISSPCQTSPGYNTTGVQQCQTNANTQCVNNGSVTKALKVCYGNRIQNDCDYGCQGSSYPPNIIFPISGSVNLGQTPASPPTGSLYIVMTDTRGGGCVLQATQNTTGSLANLITMNGSTASWNLAPASFPNQNCLQPNGMLFNYTFQLFVQTSTGFAGATFTSSTSQNQASDTVIVPQVDVMQGCLPDGTAIRMADGKDRMIETFKGYGDEKVLSQNNSQRAVTATTWGEEEKPLVSIRDDKGHNLLLTEAHPVMTPRGAVAASALKKGDVVLTDKGNATLTEVGRKSSPKPVSIHNLRVGTQDEAVKGVNTFYANGILVGDQLMQRHMMLAAAQPRKLSREEILKSLPVEWQKDYLNSLQ